MDETVAIVDFMNLFPPLPKACSSLEDLTDGHIYYHVLRAFSPRAFSPSSSSTLSGIDECTNNWALRSTNLRTILRLLTEYYNVDLRKSIVDSVLTSIDVNAMAKYSDVDEILTYSELILGAAVICENKGVIIEKICKLSTDVQQTLRVLIQNAMTNMEDFTEETEKGGDRKEYGRKNSFNDGNASENVIRLQQMVSHLQEERQQLLDSISEVESKNEALRTENDMLKENQISSSTDNSDNSNKNTLYDRSKSSNNNTNKVAALEKELDESKREFDLLSVEVQNYKSELKKNNMLLSQQKETLIKLEHEKNLMCDELDVAKAKASQLTKAESSIEKYKEKLEEFADLRKQNKDLLEKNDQYLDQIYDLEGSTKSLEGAKKMLEQYKDKCIELEREIFENVATRQLQSHEIQRLRSEIDRMVEAHRFLDDEVGSLRIRVEQYEEEGKNSSIVTTSDSTEGGSDTFEVETISSLKKKVKHLERQLRLTQTSGDDSILLHLTPLSSTDDALGVMNSSQYKLLLSELNDTKRSKKEREESLINTKKELFEANEEVTRITRALFESEQRLQLSNTTLKMLEDKLKEKVTEVNNLEQHKLKLEVYTKKSLNTFREKYMSALEKIKSNNKELADKLAVMSSKHEKSNDASRREERLLLSAMYELGVRIMDKNVQQPLVPNSE